MKHEDNVDTRVDTLAAQDAGHTAGSDSERSAHTPGPWTVRLEPDWPFRISVVGDGKDPIVEMGRVAYSTRQHSLEDVRNAKGFSWDEREKVIARVAQQEADSRLIAAAPELLAALKAAQQFLSPEISRGPAVNGWTNTVTLIEDAIAKAEGRV